MVATVVLVLCILFLLGGGARAYPRHGLAAMAPAGAVLLVVLVLWLTGHVRW